MEYVLIFYILFAYIFVLLFFCVSSDKPGNANTFVDQVKDFFCLIKGDGKKLDLLGTLRNCGTGIV